METVVSWSASTARAGAVDRLPREAIAGEQRGGEPWRLGQIPLECPGGQLRRTALIHHRDDCGELALHRPDAIHIGISDADRDEGRHAEGGVPNEPRGAGRDML